MNYSIPEIAPKVYAVGSSDWNRRLFDAFASTPMGTTYNAYLIRGTDKTALIDTVLPHYTEELLGKITQLIGTPKIDYLIMNHAEPDHAGSIPAVMAATGARLITTPKGAELAQLYYKVPPEKTQIVKNDEALALGDKTMRFIHAPFLHWPETMFTYLSEEKVLFSCDFFSAHNTTGRFDDEAEDVIFWARRYYAEIMMPLAKMGRAGMAKLKGLDIAMIAPSHGPVYRSPDEIIEHYTRWTNEETKPKAVIIYLSMYGTVEKMALAFAESLKVRGIEVRLLDLTVTDMGELPAHLLDARAVVLGTPTVLGSMHPLSMYATYLVKMLRPPLKYGVIMNSYGWGKGAIHQGLQFLEEAKIEAIGTVEVNGFPSPSDMENISTVAGQLADKMKYA